MRPRLPLLVVALLPRLLAGQGVTTAAIQGAVLSKANTPIAGASVGVTNTANGRRWEATTPSSGRYVLEDVAIGGPYRIEVRAVGFTPETRAGIMLALGQRVVANFSLQPSPLKLAPLSVTAMADPVLNPGRTGPAETITTERITTLPNIGRDFLSLTLLSPQVAVSAGSKNANTGGVTIAGQNRLLNGFQIDGGVNNDVYTGRIQPGREALPRPISIEAVQEIEVSVAPFDVRQGGFAGGLVNAVTKSGTNEIHGTVFGTLADGSLVGTNAVGDEAGGFTTWQYGGAIGGPIVHDRVHFFLNGDIQRRTIADVGPLVSDTVGGADTIGTGIRYASALRFQDILRTTYALDPGTVGPYDASVPATDLFGKVTVQLGTNSHLELSHHYTRGNRRTSIDRQFGTYFLSSLGQRIPVTANASRVIWTRLLGGRWSNELIASFLRSSESCVPNTPYPLIRVTADRGMLVAGTGVTCPASSARTVFELTENITVGFGAHVFTLGTHGELLRFEDQQLQGGVGLWNFRNLDSLAVGHAGHYERTLPGPLRGNGIEFRARQVGVYLQDRWHPTRALTLTAGVRLDVPFLPDPVATDAALQASLGIDTGELPSGDLLWSPRLGVNYDVAGRGRTFLRGGIGLFSGRPAYVWISGAYRDNGSQQLFLSCDGADVPAFTPMNQPGTCLSGAGPTQRLSFFDPNARFPQSLKVSLGLDQQLPGGLVGTVDLLYTRAQHQLYYSDANLLPPLGVAPGEGNRPMYGTVGATGLASPARRDPAFGQVVRASDRSGDQTVSVALQMRKQFADRAELSVLYARTRARDRMSLTNPLARANLETTPLDGTLDDRQTRTSFFEIPHRVELSAGVRLPLRVRLSLLYEGASGTAYSYTVRGDANADGIGSSTMTNDLAYVPRDSLDIALATPSEWASLDQFIQNEPCLRRQRGRILQRNSCRNPWFGTLSARVTKVFPTFSKHSFELTADLYNVLNMFDRDWGQARVTTSDPGTPLLLLVGYDAAAGRGVYRLQSPGFRQVQDLASRWQLELSAKYVF
jgi:Carboxypeptidase regulatory-like domain/TonB dependent receptor